MVLIQTVCCTAMKHGFILTHFGVREMQCVFFLKDRLASAPTGLSTAVGSI